MAIDNEDQYNELKPELEKLGYVVEDYPTLNYNKEYIFNDSIYPKDRHKFRYPTNGKFSTGVIKMGDGVPHFYYRKRIKEYNKDKFIELAKKHIFIYEK